MAAKGPLMDDLASLMTNAAGVAQGMRREAEVAFASYFERWLAEQDVPSREELEVVREMARKAREDNETLASRVQELEALLKVARKDSQEASQPAKEASLPPLVLQEEVSDSTPESGTA